VVLDGLGAHKDERVRELVEVRWAASYCFCGGLPESLTHCGRLLEAQDAAKKALACIRGALVEAIAIALSAVTPEDARASSSTADTRLPLNPLRTAVGKNGPEGRQSASL